MSGSPARSHGRGSAARRLEQAAARAETDTFVLRLYVAGATPRSTRAVANLRALCERHLAGRYELEVVDIYQEPQQAPVAQVLAAPTLVKVLPLPLRRLVGDLSETPRVLVGLGLPAGEE